MASNYGKGIRQRPAGTGKFYLSFTPRPGDKQREVCLETRDYAEAVQMAEVIRNRPQIKGLGTYVQDVKDYTDARMRRRSMSPETARSVIEVSELFFPFIQKDNVRLAGRKDARLWLDYLENKPVAQATLTTYHARLTAFYNWLVSEGRVDKNPFLNAAPHRIPPSQIARTAWIDKKEIRKLLSACRDKNLKFVLFMGFHCGMRKQEIISATNDWFDLQQHKINIPFFESHVSDIEGVEERFFRTKNLRDRSVPLSDEFMAFLRKHPFRKGTHYAIEPETAGKGLGKRYRWDFRRPLTEFFKKNNVQLTTHGMRHSFASNCIMAGKSTFRVASWLGNRQRTVEVHYAHLATGKGDLDNVF